MAYQINMSSATRPPLPESTLEELVSAHQEMVRQYLACERAHDQEGMEAYAQEIGILWQQIKEAKA